MGVSRSANVEQSLQFAEESSKGCLGNGKGGHLLGAIRVLGRLNSNIINH